MAKHLIITQKSNLYTVEAVNKDKFNIVNDTLVTDEYAIVSIPFETLEEIYFQMKAGIVDMDDNGWKEVF